MDALRLERPWNPLLVPQGLVWTRFVPEADVLGGDAPEVILTEDENVVDQLSAKRAGVAFSEADPAAVALPRTSAHDGDIILARGGTVPADRSRWSASEPCPTAG